MFVLGTGDAGACASVVSREAQDDDAALLSCLESVSYMKVFFCGILVLPVLFFNFLGVALDKILDCRAVSRYVAGCTHCGARRGQHPIASGA
jgi:hypothetical protein